MKIRLQRIAVAIVSVILVQGLIPNTVSYARPRTSQEAGALSLPDGKVGQSYEYQLRTEGGLPPLTWRVVGGDLPTGVSLEASGKLKGVPTTPRRSAYSFVIEVSDSSQPPEKFAQPFLLMIQAAPLRILADGPKLKIVPPETASDAGKTSSDQPASVSVGSNRAERGIALDKIRKLSSNSQAVAHAAAVHASENSSGPAATEPSGGAAPASPETNRTPTANLRTTSGNPSSDPPKVGVVCGQLSLASLNEVIAFVNDLAQVDLAKIPDGARKTEMQRLQKNVKDRLGENSDFLNSWLTDECGEDPSRVGRKTRGDQRMAVIAQLLDGLHLLSQLPTLQGVVANKNVSKELIEKQIVLLQQYLGNVTVNLRGGTNNALLDTKQADKDGNFKFDKVDISNSPFTISTEGDQNNTKREFTLQENEIKRENLLIEDRPVSLLTRAVVGYQQAAAAASKVEQNYFLDLFISKTLPFPQKINPDFGERWRAWFAGRAISVPQSGEATIGDLSTGLATNISGLKVKDAARVFDFLGGLEIRLGGNTSLLPSFDRQTKQKFSASFIVGLGFVTPTDPHDQISIFKVFDDAPGLPPQAKGKQFVAFVQSDRDRFFRQYYAGFRFQTFFFNRYNVPMQRFPAQFDITVGQNEYVTGGHLRGPVVRFDAYFPLPYENLKFINLYSTLVVQPTRVKTSIPLILEPVTDSSVKVPGPNVALIPVSQFARDYYKVGIGMDFISFVQKLMSAGKK